MAAATKDPDANLHQTLAQGVPTGIFDSIASSLQWPQRQADLPCDAPDDITLLHCSVARPLRMDIEQGWIQEFQGSIEEAKDNWPQRTDIGKLSAVFAEGKEPRLALDSAVCHASPLCRLPEHVSLPSALDVHRALLCTDQYSGWNALALDVKAAQDNQGSAS